MVTYAKQHNDVLQEAIAALEHAVANRPCLCEWDSTCNVCNGQFKWGMNEAVRIIERLKNPE